MKLNALADCDTIWKMKIEKKTNCNDCCHLTQPQTNADRIRAMSDEELAEFICGIYDEDDPIEDNEIGKFINGCFIPCYDQYSIKEWLQQPAED